MMERLFRKLSVMSPRIRLNAYTETVVMKSCKV
jgi:hypothetical protein